MSKLYGRAWRILISRDGTNALDVSKLDITFSVTKSLGDDGNSAEATVYNLSPASIRGQIAEGSRVIIEAGYQNSPYGMIFDGDVVGYINYKEGNVTRVLNLYAKDGDVFLNGNFISESYAAGMTTQDFLQNLVGLGGVTLGDISPGLANAQLPRGRALYGQPRQLLNQFAKTEGGRAYVSDRKIHLIKADDPPTGQIISLTPDSGLVGSPKQNDDGNIEGTCLLNPQINLNKFVHVSSSNISRSLVTSGEGSALAELSGSGVYRIIKLVHRGDTRGNDWYTDFVGIPQPGMSISSVNMGR